MRKKRCNKLGGILIKGNMTRKKLPTLIFLLVFAVGISLLLYPTVSDYWNARHQTRAIVSYSDEVDALGEAKQEELLEAAREYNQKLYESGTHWTLSEEEQKEYDSLLNMSSDGIMGYVSIPKIGVTLPIYHGTAANVLQKGAGHLEGSSLPVGGENTHAVLSSHRGLVSAKLFTDLDELQNGDIFTITVLNETLTYEVDQILIVLPTELDELAVEEGKDYCTLVTCTPYGVNTHRLLVRGHRVEASEVVVSGDALQLESSVIAPLVAVPILVVLLILLFISTKKRRQR